MSDAPPRVPTAWQLERAVSAWQQLREIYAADPTLADDEEGISRELADADITHPDVLLGRAIDAVVWCERREVEADELRREMVARRDRYRARAETIRAIIENLLIALEKTKHAAKWGAASFGTSPRSVVITDAELVPDEFWRVERTLMKDPIHDAIDAGKTVPGAVLSNPAPYLRIRKL
jgi:hypothetical protein